LAAAGVGVEGASAASVQLDLSGMTALTSTPSVPYNLTLAYDSSAAPIGPGVYPVTSYSGPGSAMAPNSYTVVVENDVTSAAPSNPTVDRLTFHLKDFSVAYPLLNEDTVFIELDSSFLPAVQLPTFSQLQSAIASNLILGIWGTGTRLPYPGAQTITYFAYINTITPSGTPDPNAVPTPAAAAGALPLLGLAALARRRGVRPV
jgi:hypothetical protein